jgi:hypothetical protein
MSIFGDFWNKKLTASFWPLGWPLPPKRKKLQLEPILTNYLFVWTFGRRLYELKLSKTLESW